jgi:hypothetical protein
MTTMTICDTLQRIHGILQSHSGDSAAWLARVVALCEQDEQAFYRELNSKRMWGGAGSIANEALADNPGMEGWLWQADITAFRELMIELGHHLKARGNANPDISSWLLAFSNWNQSNV